MGKFELKTFVKSRDFRLALCHSGNFFIFLGLNLNLGLFFLDWKEEFEESSSAVSVVHSVAGGLGPILAIFSTFTYNAGFPTWAAPIVGGVIFGVGLVAASLAKSMTALIFLGGVLPFSCASLIILTGAIIISQRVEEKHRHMCITLMFLAGIAGKTCLAFVITWLKEQFAWRGAFLILGGFGFNIVALGWMGRPREVVGKKEERIEIKERKEDYKEKEEKDLEVEKEDPKIEKSRKTSAMEIADATATNAKILKTIPFCKRSCLTKIFDFSILKNRVFLLYLTAHTLINAVDNSIQVYLSPFARHDNGASSLDLALIQTVFSAFEVVGCLGMGLIGVFHLFEEGGPILLLLFSCCISGALAVLSLTKNLTDILIVISFVGILSGAFQPLFFSVPGDIFGTKSFHKTIGLLQFSGGIAAIALPPLVGLHLDTKDSYRDAFYFLSAMELLSVIIMSFAIALFRRNKENCRQW